MITDKKLHELSESAISELEADEEFTNLKMAIREHYDDWTTRLFPLLQAKKQPCYAYVVALLQKAGYTHAEYKLVKDYFSEIRVARRAERERQAQFAPSRPFDRAQAPLSNQPPPSPVIEPEKHAVAPATQSVSSVKKGVSPVLFSVVAVPVSGAEGWQAEYERLAREKSEGWSEWSGNDQAVWDMLALKAKKKFLRLTDIHERSSYLDSIAYDSPSYFEKIKPLFDKLDYLEHTK